MMVLRQCSTGLRAALQNTMSLTSLSYQLILFYKSLFEIGVFVASVDAFGTKVLIFDLTADT